MQWYCIIPHTHREDPRRRTTSIQSIDACLKRLKRQKNGVFEICEDDDDDDDVGAHSS